MKLPLVVAFTALLAGCALSPAEVRERGTKFETNISRVDTMAFAHCIQRNAENQSGLHTADVRPFGKSGAEVIVRGGDAGAFAIIEITDFKTIGWIGPNEPNDHKAVFFSLLKGC